MARRVLVIAEEHTSAAWLCATLEPLFEVATTNNVAVALDVISHASYNAIVCDLSTSVDESIAFLNRVSAVAPAIGGVLLVNHADYTAVADSLHSSRFTVLFRPVDPEKLRCWVKNAMMLTKVKKDTDRIKAPPRHV